MKFKDIFHLPSYITGLEEEIYTSEKIQEERIKDTNARITDLEKQLELFKGKVGVMESYFISSPQKNDIESNEVEEVEIDETFRVPIVEGVKMRFEDEPEDSARPINVYGPGQISTKIN